MCYQRWNGETVPGCSGEDYSNTDFCCEYTEGYLFHVGNDGEPADKFPLKECQGDCDNDDECLGLLICQQRSGTEEVPGCDGIGKDGGDYCRYNVILGECQPGCDSDDDCQVMCPAVSFFNVCC